MFHVEHTHMTQNIVKDALDNGLTVKQERFARAIANGETMCESGRQAGYLTFDQGYSSSLPSRTLQNTRVQARIQALINASNYEALTHSHWQEVLCTPLPDGVGSQAWGRVVDAKNKAIDQIARLGGWEPSKQTETKQLVLKGQIKDILPK